MTWRRSLLALAALALAAPALGCIGFLLVAAREPAEPDRHTDGIAVLTGGAERVDTGIRLLRDGQAQWLLISGAHPQAHLSDLLRGQEAAALAPRVTLGRAAATTHGNAAEIASWARAHQIGSLRVVTAGYHMPRALLELRRALPGTAFLAHPVQPASLREGGWWRAWRLLLGEYLKLLGAYAGVTRLLPPPQEGR